MPSFFSREKHGKVGRESGDLYGSKPSVAALGSAFGVLGTIPAVPAAVVTAILVQELWFKRLEKGDERMDKEDKGEGT